MRPALDGRASLAWRLRQQALDVPVSTGVVGVAERVLAARAWPLELAELAFGVRQADPEIGGVGRALEGGELVQSYAFRGGSYVFTPAIAAVLLTVRTTNRVWETRRYQSQIGHEIDDWEPLREAVREALGEGPATRAEIADHLRRSGSLADLAEAAAPGAVDVPVVGRRPGLARTARRRRRGSLRAAVVPAALRTGDGGEPAVLAR